MMNDLRIPEGINEEKLRRAVDALGNERSVSITRRWSFGVKGFKSVSIVGWIKSLWRKG